MTITRTKAPALGDLYTAGPGDVIRVRRDAVERKDWGRYWLALGVAWSRGAEVELREERME